MIGDCKTCDPTRLLRPRELFEDLDRRRLLVPGPDLVVVVTNDESEELLGVSPLAEDWTEPESSFGDDVAEAIQRAGGGERRQGPCDKTGFLVRRRLGRTVPLPRDMDGWIAWLNGHQATDAYAGDWLLITDHGWRSLLSHAGPAGEEPHLRARPSLRVA